MDQKVERTNVQEIFELNEIQKGMLYHYLNEPAENLYNVRLSFDINGELDTAMLKQAFNLVQERNETLRSVFRWEEVNTPVQIILKECAADLTWFDISDNTPEYISDFVQQLSEKECKERFDLSRLPLRLSVIKTSGTSYVFNITHHHILYDGWSTGILLKELFYYYNQLSTNSGQAITFVSKASLGDVLRPMRKNTTTINEEGYWQQYLEAYEITTLLPPGKYKTDVKEKVRKLQVNIPAAGLENFSREHKVTRAAVIYAAYGILLQKYCNVQDIVFGTTVSSRDAAVKGSSEVMGNFINTIPLRITASGAHSLLDLVRGVNQDLMGRSAFHDTSYLGIKQLLNLSPDEDLFDSVVIIENYPLDKAFVNANERFNIRLKAVYENTGIPLVATVFFNEALEIELVYQADVISDAYAQSFADHFAFIIREITDHFSRELQVVCLVSEQEKHRLLEAFNDTAITYARNKTIVSLFEEQVLKTPEHTALVCNGHQLSYRQLNEKANSLAALIRESGIKPNQVVALYTSRSVEMVLGMIAVLKSGGCYLPLDPSYPAERLEYMLSDAKAAVLLVSADLSGAALSDVYPVPVIYVNHHLLEESREDLPQISNAEDLAYVIYTSGSTGRPKGVMLPHRAVHNYIISMAEHIPFTAGKTIVSVTSFSFDIFVTESLLALTRGMKVIIADEAAQRDPVLLSRLLKQHRVNIMQTTPSRYQLLTSDPEVFSDAMQDMEYLLVGGEPFAEDLLTVLRTQSGARIINVYGPTETTVWSTLIDVTHEERITIGKPIGNTRLYILDKQLQLQPVGVDGELYIGGDGLAHGYWNNIELTNKQFISNPYAPGEKMYRTGDKARWLQNGTVEYRGRIDNQVKIRGHRIELEEIEHQLSRYEGVGRCAVTARADDGTKHLLAYYEAAQEIPEQALSSFLSEKLPEYMMPARFIRMENMPLTPNGKLNRKALPEPESRQPAEYIAPADETMAKLVEIWGDVLKTDKTFINTEKSFFELGGHSLKAVLLLNKIFKAFSVRLSLSDVFKHPSISRLSKVIREKTGQQHPAIDKAPDQPYYRLSSAQRGLYFLYGYNRQSVSYNIQALFPINGVLHKERVKEVLQVLMARHESLRTSFELINDCPVQKIWAFVEPEITYYNNPAAPDAAFVTQFKKPFDLEKPPLFRVGVITSSADENFLLFDIHHIISDRISLDILKAEFCQLYEGKELPSLKLQYRDYAEWQYNAELKASIEKQEDYWIKELKENLPVLNLPADVNRADGGSEEGGVVSTYLNPEYKVLLDKCSHTSGISTSMAVYAMFSILLSRLSGQEDIVIGLSSAIRDHADLEGVVGVFVNPLPIRCFPAHNKSLKAFLQEIKETTLSAYDHKDYQFDRLVDRLGIPRLNGRNPLYNVLLNFEKQVDEVMLFSEERPGAYTHLAWTKRFDLTLNVTEYRNTLYLQLQYDAGLFHSGTAERFLEYFVNIIARLDQGLSTIGMITPEERHQLLYTWNNTAAAYPGNENIFSLFETQAAGTPDEVALRCGETIYSYRELKAAADRMAAYLENVKQVSAGDFVGLMLEREECLVPAILGILKLGAAYVPIDPYYPVERIRTVIEDAGLKALITRGKYREKINAGGLELVDLDQELAAISGQPAGLTAVKGGGADTAYMIYTSGSTGRPKGVMIAHSSLINYISWAASYYIKDKKAVFALYTSISFDLTVTAIFTPLITGNEMIVYREEDDRLLIEKVVRGNKATIIKLTPSHLKILNDSSFPEPSFNRALTGLIVGGEELDARLARDIHEKFGGSVEIYNEYGPTEATVGCMIYKFSENEGELSVPIGYPINNTQIYLLNDQLSPVPLGMYGEIYISGDGVAKGYWKREELTAERFINNPFLPGSRMYKTGDLGRRLWDGNIIFKGRIDEQVKISGFRIELGEIESRLAACDGIKEAVAAVKEINADRHLVGYYVSDKELDAGALRDYLSAHLPHYMVPYYYVRLEKLPLTPNGKLDRKQLPEPDLVEKDEYIGPSNETEEKLVKIWSAVLKMNPEQLSVQKGFFELGGNSLKAILLLNRIFKELNVKISIESLFKNQDISSLGRFIQGARKTVFSPVSKAPAKENYKLSSAQKRLYFLYELDRSSVAYNLLFVATLEGVLDKPRLKRAFEGLIARHESLRTSFYMELDEPVQKIWEHFDFDIAYYGPEENEAEIIERFQQPFDLAKAPLIKAGVIARTQQEHVLMVGMHHIITDGLSVEVIIKDFTALFNEGAALPPLPLQYKDYAEWQHETAEKNKMAEQKAFWINEFSGNITALSLPADFTRAARKNNRGDSLTFEISAADTAQLKAIALAEGATLFMALLAIYNILLSKLGNQEDIIVGTPVAGRSHADLDGIIGVFVNTLALRNYPSGDLEFKRFLADVRTRTLACFNNDAYPYEELIDELNIVRDLNHHPLFDTMLVFQNFNTPEIEMPGIKLKRVRGGYVTTKFDITLTAYEHNGGLLFNFEYAAELFRKQTIERFIAYFRRILHAVTADPQIRIADIEIIAAQEKQELLSRLDNTSCDYPQDKTVTDLFEEQVQRTPHNIAIKCGEQQLSYRELDQRATKLAVVLTANGVRSGDIVGLLLDRSIEVVVGMLAILKAGAAYLPIDIDYPAERKAFIINDSKTRLLLTSRQLQNSGTGSMPAVFIEDAEVIPAAVTGTAHINSPADLCYVIYTSGTTGQPKGVMVEHRNVVRLFFNSGFQFSFNETDVWTMFHSPCFDFSVWEMYGALLFGGKLVVIPKMVARDTSLYLDILRAEAVTILNQTPSAFYNLVREELQYPVAQLALKYVIFGGEALSPGKLHQWRRRYPQVKLINMFGITETTVHVTYKEIGDHEIASNISNIGKPIPTLSVYILDKYQRLAPAGVTGELYVGGAGVSRGYLGREALTKERFIPDPYKQEQRLYRSGDLARMLDSGDIEYLGRMDHQVQLRGFRIELGEIESQLAASTEIKEAVVLIRGEEDKYLVAYYVADAVLPVNELRALLSGKLPDYMVPGYYVRVECLPLTVNGKLDRDALPDPVVALENDYVPPVTKEEKLLADIWSKVLGVSNIGITDNFFSAGGDSIKSIQISARVRSAGYELTIKDIFVCQTIKELALKLTAKAAVSDQSLITGTAALSPVQQWFFDHHPIDSHHFNQSVMLNFPEGISAETVQRIFEKLQNHHDALRMVFIHTAEGVIQENRGNGLPVSIEVCDLKGSGMLSAAVRLSACNELQAGINLETGPLVKLGLFHMDDGSRLLIVIHHLVIDGISWRILFEDIDTLYRQIKEGRPLQLPLKTDAFLRWPAHLAAYAAGKEFQRTQLYWKTLLNKEAGIILRDYPDGSNCVGDAKMQSFCLSTDETSRLLNDVHSSFATRINDILLSALLLAVKTQYGNNALLVDLEGHGRDGFDAGIDISRTVGWFTSIYPVLLESASGELSGMIRQVKEQLGNIPDNGAGYLLHQYQEAQAGGITGKSGARICFNYLGQFDSDITGNAYQLTREPRGDEISAKAGRLYDWELSAAVIGGQLEMSLTYSKKQYNKETISAFMQAYKESLQEITAYCCSYGSRLLSPSDLTYKALTISELDVLQEKYALKDIYPLSPMQEGMLFHALLDEEADHYFEQMSCRIKGDLDLMLVEESMNDIISRYDILRTVFLHEGYKRPLQMVLQQRKIDLTYRDIRKEYKNGSGEAAVTQYQQQDRNVKFNLRNTALMRLSVLRLADDEYELIWSHHHILMDGWCMSIIMRDFNERYVKHRQKQPLLLSPAQPYSDFITWLEGRDKSVSAAYWKNYLSACDAAAALPQREQLPPGKLPHAPASCQLVLGPELTTLLQQLSRTCSVTVNTILQTAWGILLAKYNNVQDVVFGAVVSGRPAEIPGIESMVGLFINTIPVRVKYELPCTVDALLREVQDAALQSVPHHYHPLAEILAASETGRELINHILVFENYPVAEEIVRASPEDTGYRITDIRVFEQTNYDLSIIIQPGEEIRLHFEYNANRYEQDVVERASAHFKQVIEQMVTAPEMQLAAIDLLTPDERRQLLYTFNDTGVQYPEYDTIISLFEERVKAVPDKPAVTYRDTTCSYRALKESAGRIAFYLQTVAAVKAGDLVGVLLERDEHFIPVVFGILMAGGVYVPIDPAYPAKRINAIIDDSKMQVLLTKHKFLDAAVTGILTVTLDHVWDTIATCPANAAPVNVSGEDAAYVIYTSGSTGSPKGVMVDHHALLNTLLGMQQRYPVKNGDSYLLKTTCSFDVSLMEIFGWIPGGGMLSILPPDAESDAASILNAITAGQVTHINFVPSMFAVFVTALEHIGIAGIESLRYIFLAGEELPAELVMRFRSLAAGIELENVYGPTEGAIYSCSYDTRQLQNARRVPIGKPLGNIKLYILGLDGNPQPIGASGELCIGGASLAKGYLYNEMLTEEKFTGAAQVSAGRIYHTGDLARWLPDGDIEFLGRADNQVKIRGIRIETGEIEVQLSTHEEIRETLVTVLNRDGNKYLVAYYTAGRELDVAELRHYLEDRLPRYMVPVYYVHLDSIPLTAAGKADRRALPAPGIIREGGYVAPAGPVAMKLAVIWAELLKTDKGIISANRSFFELGGHSIMAIHLINAIHDEYGVSITLREVFNNTTIEKLAALVKDRGVETVMHIPRAAEKDHYPASPAQERLFYEHLLDEEKMGYHICSIYEIREALDPVRIRTAFQLLVNRHESLRTCFKLLGDEVVQQVVPQVDLNIQVLDDARCLSIEAALEEFVQPFDLSAAPLIRCALLNHQGQKHLLFIDIHHIICDGVSLGILLNDFKQLYRGLEPAPLTLRYVDYAAWKKGAAASGERQKQYWLNKLYGQIPALDLPALEGRKNSGVYATDSKTLELNGTLYQRIRKFTSAADVSDFMMFLSVYYMLLSRISGNTDIIIGTDVVGRTQPELKAIVGTFINWLPLRMQIDTQTTFIAFLKKVRSCVLEAFDNQDFAFEEMVSRLNKEKRLNGKLFDVHFSVTNYLDNTAYSDEIKMTPLQIRLKERTPFEFKLEAADRGDKFNIVFVYARELYDSSTMELFIRYYYNILLTVLENEHVKLEDIEIMERQDYVLQD